MSNCDCASDRRLLLINEADNCLVVCEPLLAGAVVMVSGVNIEINDFTPLGHKLARCNIPKGEKVMRYGECIGIALQDIVLGEHIHTHNLTSNYLPTFTLEQGMTYVGRH